MCLLVTALFQQMVEQGWKGSTKYACDIGIENYSISQYCILALKLFFFGCCCGEVSDYVLSVFFFFSAVLEVQLWRSKGWRIWTHFRQEFLWFLWSEGKNFTLQEVHFLNNIFDGYRYFQLVSLISSRAPLLYWKLKQVLKV